MNKFKPVLLISLFLFGFTGCASTGNYERNHPVRTYHSHYLHHDDIYYDPANQIFFHFHSGHHFYDHHDRYLLRRQMIIRNRLLNNRVPKLKKKPKKIIPKANQNKRKPKTRNKILDRRKR